MHTRSINLLAHLHTSLPIINESNTSNQHQIFNIPSLKQVKTILQTNTSTSASIGITEYYEYKVDIKLYHCPSRLLVLLGFLVCFWPSIEISRHAHENPKNIMS